MLDSKKKAYFVACFSLGAALSIARAAVTNDEMQLRPFTGLGEVRGAVWTISSVPDSRTLRITIECSGFSAVPFLGGYSLRIPEQASSGKPGAPDVPCLARLLPGIQGMRAVLKVQGQNPTNVMGIAVVAAEGFRLDDSENFPRVLRPFRQPDPDIFAQDQFWPQVLSRVEEGSIGTQKVVRVECCPVQYNPTTKTIRFYRRLEGELSYEPNEITR